jgi:hypothetical protein
VLVVVLAGWSFAAAPPARLTAEQAEQLAQSQRWLQQANTHFAREEIDKTIAAIHKGLALERAVFGQLGGGSLPWLFFAVGRLRPGPWRAGRCSLPVLRCRQTAPRRRQAISPA